jgi:hypothetical protein
MGYLPVEYYDWQTAVGKTKTPEPVWALWGGEKSLASAGNPTLGVQPVAHCSIDWALTAHSTVYLSVCQYETAKS